MRFPCFVGLAPLAGYTNYPFRLLSYRYGACFAFTEMISARSVFEGPGVVEKMLPRPEEPYTGVQIFGVEEIWLGKTAAVLEDKGAFVDLNAGCPVRKVVKKGMGGALLRDLTVFKRVLTEIRRAVNSFFTVKTRLGWENDEVEKVYYIAVEAGADAVFVHARTVKQGFSGEANWKALSRIREKPVPLFISGDIFTPEDVKSALEVSEADGVLVARGSIGNPWIFAQVKDLFEKGRYNLPSPYERLEVFMEHLEMNAKFFGEKKGVVEMRKMVGGYTRGMPFAKEFRRRFMKVETLKDAKRLINEYQKIFSTSNSHITRF